MNIEQRLIFFSHKIVRVIWQKPITLSHYITVFMQIFHGLWSLIC